MGCLGGYYPRNGEKERGEKTWDRCVTVCPAVGIRDWKKSWAIMDAMGNESTRRVRRRLRDRGVRKGFVAVHYGCGFELIVMRRRKASCLDGGVGG